MPHPSKAKGDRFERSIVGKFREAGYDAQRIPLSGAAGGNFTGDLQIYLPGMTLRGECKARGNGSGFKSLEKWLAGNDVLFLHRDRQDPLVVLPWDNLIALLGGLGDGAESHEESE